MSLFRQKTDIQKNYKALLGPDTGTVKDTSEAKISNKVLELTPSMVLETPAHDKIKAERDELAKVVTKARARVQTRDKELLQRQTELNNTRFDLVQAQTLLIQNQRDFNHEKRNLAKERSELAEAMRQSRSNLVARDQELLARQTELNEAHFDLAETRQTLSRREHVSKTQKKELSRAISQMTGLKAALNVSQTKLENAHNLLQKADRIMVSRKTKLVSAQKDLAFARDELGAAQSALSETKDRLNLSEFKRSSLTDSKNEVAALNENLERLRAKLEASKNLVRDHNIKIENLSEALSVSDNARARLEAKLRQSKSKLMETRGQLSELQRNTDHAQTEIKLVTAKNRALQRRLENLRSELNSLAPRPDIIPAALSRFHKNSGQTDVLVKALETSKANEVSLTDKIERAEKDMAMMEDVNKMLREKFTAFDRQDQDQPRYVTDDLSIPRRYIK